MSADNPLEKHIPLVSFSDFARAVPQRWRNAPVYVSDSIGQYHKAVRVLLVRDDAGKKVIVIDREYSKLKTEQPPK